MVFTRDVLEKLIETACDNCHHTYTCSSSEELHGKYCVNCFCEAASHFIEAVHIIEEKKHAAR